MNGAEGVLVDFALSLQASDRVWDLLRGFVFFHDGCSAFCEGLVKRTSARGGAHLVGRSRSLSDSPVHLCRRVLFPELSVSVFRVAAGDGVECC